MVGRTYRDEGAALRVSDLLISPTEVEIGEAINISVSVTYAGDVTRTFTVALKVNGSVEATKQLTVSGGESAVVTFDVARDVAGTYDVEVDRLAGTFVVRAPRRAQFEVTDLSISPAVAAMVCIGVVIIILSLIARSMAK